MANESSEKQISAAEWRRSRLALADRLRRLRDSRLSDMTPAEAQRLQKEIETLKAQIGTLAVEETVAQFVEDAERYVIVANTVAEDWRRDPDEEPA